MSTEHTADEVSTVREATGDDLDAVLRVGHRTWPVTYGPVAGDEYVAMGLAKWWTADAVIPAIRAGRALVAQVGDEVVGVATYGTQAGEVVLWKLYVLPEYQGHGLGHLLLEEVARRARDLGHAKLLVSSLDGNEGARRFYARHGFVDDRREDGGSGLPDSIWMVRELDDEETR